MKVRRATTQDAEHIHTAHMKSIQEVCAKDHSPEEIQAWGHRPYREDQRLNAIKNDFVWVVENQGSIEGYGHLKISEQVGHVFGLYLTPLAIGKSLGKTIVSMMMEEIRTHKVNEVTLESTITARNFYRKMGFVDNGFEMTLEINNTPIRCYPMILKLP